MNKQTNIQNVESNNDKNSYEWVLFKESGELWEIRYDESIAVSMDNIITVEYLEVNNFDYKTENGELIDYLHRQKYEITGITFPSANSIVYHFKKVKGGMN